MWNSKKYLAMAVVGAGLAVAAASPASAQFIGGTGFGPWNTFGMAGGYGGYGGLGGIGYPGYWPTSYYPPYYPQQPQVIVLRVGGGPSYGAAYGCAPRPVFGCGCGMARAYVRPSYGCGYGRVVMWRHAYPTVALHHPARVNAVYAARAHHGHLFASHGVKRHYAKHGYSLKFA